MIAYLYAFCRFVTAYSEPICDALAKIFILL